MPFRRLGRHSGRIPAETYPPPKCVHCSPAAGKQQFWPHNPKDILYAGTAPALLMSQRDIRIPAGNQPLQIRFNSPLITSKPGAFSAIAAPYRRATDHGHPLPSAVCMSGPTEGRNGLHPHELVVADPPIGSCGTRAAKGTVGP